MVDAKDIKFTADDVNKASIKRRLHNEQWYGFAVVDASAEIARSSKSLMIVLQLAPLLDPDDINSVKGGRVRQNIVLPFINPEEAGHEAPNTGPMTVQNMQAFFPEEIPFFPRKNSKTGEWEFEDGFIAEDDVQKKKDEITTKAYKKAIALYGDPSALLNHGVFGKVKWDGDFDGIGSMRAELPENAELITDPKLFQTGTATGANGKANGKRTRPSRAKAKTKTRTRARA